MFAGSNHWSLSSWTIFILRKKWDFPNPSYIETSPLLWLLRVTLMRQVHGSYERWWSCFYVHLKRNFLGKLHDAPTSFQIIPPQNTEKCVSPTGLWLWCRMLLIRLFYFCHRTVDVFVWPSATIATSLFHTVPCVWERREESVIICIFSHVHLKMVFISIFQNSISFDLKFNDQTWASEREKCYSALLLQNEINWEKQKKK